MKALRALIPAIAAVGLSATAVDAQAQTHHGSGGHWSGGHSSGGHYSGGHWGGGHWGGGHWRGSFGIAIGAPLFWWGWPGYYPYYYDSYYYGPPVVYREVLREYPEGEMAPPPTTDAPQAGPGAPTQGPLYMNYCESAKAYYPKVASCPEGWRFIAPQR